MSKQNPVERVQRALRSDPRRPGRRASLSEPASLAAAEALRQLQRRGEAQLDQSSPTTVWRKPAIP